MKKIILNDPVRGLVEVDPSDHRWAQINQGVGFYPGYAVGTVVWSLGKLLEMAGNTNVGLGGQHGYHKAHFDLDCLARKRELSKIGVEGVRAMAAVHNIELEGKGDNEVMTLMTRATVKAEYQKKGEHELMINEPRATIRRIEKTKEPTGTAELAAQGF